MSNAPSTRQACATSSAIARSWYALLGAERVVDAIHQRIELRVGVAREVLARPAVFGRRDLAAVELVPLQRPHVVLAEHHARGEARVRPVGELRWRQVRGRDDA